MSTRQNGRAATEGAGKPLVSGTVIPLITALDPHGRPAAEAIDPLLTHLAAGGVTSLLLAGTNGEGPLLSGDDVRRYATEVTTRWRVLAGADATVMVAATGPGTRETRDRVELLDGVDLDAVVVLAPFYFKHTERELLAHFQAVAALGRPVVVYNSPAYTGNPVPVSLVRRLLDEPGIAGLKDNSGDASQFARLCDLAAERPGFGVAQGVERQLDIALRLGASGTVPGVGMLAPALCVDLFHAGRNGDHETATKLQHDVDRLAALFAIRPGASGVVVMKTALHLLGLAPATAAEPFQPCTDAELSALRTALDGLGDVLRPA
ncbi:MAG: dihydrodipicolinate synthase family protein [Hamadaea sp.]|uniref:dihydrodipicolinate synthase family protein n=1 Tax=Hamadaea sp. TaxID=2024425 RepID=UPI0017F5A789|nr:dihydrodipicolinate synthase family protein [Hamadaea sp.]NUR71436.1 dihydrodipicolinate synthase family protein [Hamadaea sp.]NUT23746.1 dihydrodipicolinate synthase family protein [Hamadaea sp.]